MSNEVGSTQTAEQARAELMEGLMQMSRRDLDDFVVAVKDASERRAAYAAAAVHGHGSDDLDHASELNEEILRIVRRGG